jgi:multidrug transporter EmrE-like cation transporter
MPSLLSEPDRLTLKAEPIPAKKNPWYLNAYLHVGLTVMLSAIAQLLFKVGSDQTPGGSLLGFASLKSDVVWLGIGCMIGSLLAWLQALRSLPLIIAFNLAAATQVVVPLGSWLFLGEEISILRWIGVFVVTLGVIVIAKPLAKLEERL